MDRSHQIACDQEYDARAVDSCPRSGRPGEQGHGRPSTPLRYNVQILTGSADLVELDEESLRLRGKNSKQKSPAKPSKAQQSVLTPKKDTQNNHQIDTSLLKLIDGSDKTAFQKTCLKLLCQIPPGTYSTYGERTVDCDTVTRANGTRSGAMAKHLSSSARAVGNAMRGNPFAPRVPCHRILASDGTLGGFGGSWGVDGKHANEKLDLLKEEGVRFDSKGKVVGPVFTGFA